MSRQTATLPGSVSGQPLHGALAASLQPLLAGAPRVLLGQGAEQHAQQPPLRVGHQQHDKVVVERSTAGFHDPLGGQGRIWLLDDVAVAATVSRVERFRAAGEFLKVSAGLSSSTMRW